MSRYADLETHLRSAPGRWVVTGGAGFIGSHLTERLLDHMEQEVARITKTWEGLAKTMFTTADNYLLDVQPACQGTLRWLVFASAISVDLALKQDARGLG